MFHFEITNLPIFIACLVALGTIVGFLVGLHVGRQLFED